jgi:uncharacterized RDD family membrane protein YckC
MSSTKPPADGDAPGSDSLWQILNNPGNQSAPVEDVRLEKEPSGDQPPQQPASPRLKAPARPAAVEPAQPAPPPEEAGANILQRILSDPDDLGPDYEYRPAGTVEERVDFDNALLNYYRDTGITVNCRNHPDQSASGGQCPECTAYFCQSCMVVRKGRYLCRDCADALYVPDAEQVLSAQERGLETPETDVLLPQYPEFQVGNEIFGREGTPAAPIKQILALGIDFVILRLVELGLLLLLGVFFSGSAAPIFHLFSGTETDPVGQRVFEAAVLLQPLVPWLIFFAVMDYIYFFLCLTVANRTVGMSWTGCRVVTEWGDYVNVSSIALRTMVFMVCLGVPALLIGWLFPAYRGPHDYAAGTLVINYSGVKRVDAYETVQIKL